MISYDPLLHPIVRQSSTYNQYPTVPCKNFVGAAPLCEGYSTENTYSRLGLIRDDDREKDEMTDSMWTIELFDFSILVSAEI